MGTYGDKWKAAKVLFQKTAKVKKPSAKVDSFFRKPTGIEKILAKIDAAEASMNLKPESFKIVEAGLFEYRKAKDAYLNVLNATVGNEPKGADKDAYTKGVAVLKTQLVAIDSQLKNALATAKSAYDGRKGMEIMADNLMNLIESGCNSGMAFVAKVKAKPTAKFFNDNVEKAARDITQNIGNIDKLKSKGFTFTKAQPTGLFNVLKAWGNDGRRVPDTATKEEVLRELHAFEQAVKGVQKWAA